MPVDQPLLGYYIHPQGMAHDVDRSEREFAYVELKYARQRTQRQVSLDTAIWLAYLAQLSYNSGRRLEGTRLQWQLLVRTRKRPEVRVFVRGWSPVRPPREAGLPVGWEPMIGSWLPDYTTGWPDADADAVAAAGGRYDRVAALRRSAASE